MPTKSDRATIADSCQPPRRGRVLVVTGTDTGVGKTVVAALLVRSLRAGGVNAIGLKPLCSGGREDAVALRDAADGVLALDEVNPWSFAAALTPMVAARRVGKSVSLAAVVAHVRKVTRRCDIVVVEGAGGLLSPLGMDFDTRDLIQALQATTIVVCPNRLGAINQSLLVWEALPRLARRQAKLVLVETPNGDPSSRSNLTLLCRGLGEDRVLSLPWLAPSAMADLRGEVRRSGRRLREAVSS